MLFSTSQDGFISLSRNRNFKANVTDTIVIVGTALGVLWIDQYTKRLILTHVRYHSYVHLVIPRFLRWNFTENLHGAFGLFGSNAVLLIGMAMVVLVIFWFSYREAAAQSRLVRVAFGMIIGGAIGNIVDRLHYGYVIDFIDFYRIWPNIFNVADSCITVGVSLLLISGLVARRHH
jgi:signal peptidase II